MKVAIFDLDGTLIKWSGERRFLPWMIFNLKLNPFRFIPFFIRSIKDRNFYSTKLYYKGEKIERFASLFFSSEPVKDMIFEEGRLKD